MTDNNLYDRHSDKSDVLSLLQTIDQLYQVSCSVLNDHTQTSLRVSIAIEAQMLLSKLQAMNRRWKIHLPFKEACQVDFFDWAVRMAEISKEIAATMSDESHRKFVRYCPSKHFMLDLYTTVEDYSHSKEIPYYEETDINKFVEQQKEMLNHLADSWKDYVTEVSNRAIEDLATKGEADIELSSDGSLVQSLCGKVLKELSDELYALNQRLTTPITRKDFSRLAERILIEEDYGGNYAFRKAKAKVNMWCNKTPYDRIETERDEKIKETIAEIEKTKFGGQFMQNVKIHKDLDTQRDSFGKFLFSVRANITKEDLSKLFELIFRIYHLRRVSEQDEQEVEDTPSQEQAKSSFGQMDAGTKNPPLPLEFSQNFRGNDEAVAKFYELLRKVGPYMNRPKRKADDGTATSRYSAWKWIHLEDALIRMQLLVRNVGKRTFSDFIHSVFHDRSSDSVYRALYRSDESTYRSTVSDVMKYFKPVVEIIDKGLR